MKFLRYLLPAIASFAVTSSAFAAGAPDLASEDDTVELREYLSGKSGVNLADKSQELHISGDVRAIWRSEVEMVDGEKKRGSGTDTSNNDFFGQADLRFAYFNQNAYARADLQMFNSLGVQTGEYNNLDLQRAFIGYTILQDGGSSLALEIGRHKAYDLFDSKVQFKSTYDGFALLYNQQCQQLGNLFVRGGGMVVNNLHDDYAWIGQAGLTNLFGTGFFFKYSISDWGRVRYTDATGAYADYRADYLISQFLAGFDFDPTFFHLNAKVYGAYIINHDAARLAIANNSKQNDAWYAGFTLGKLEKAGDYSIDVNYQYVEAQAIVETDVLGIGRGNLAKNHFYKGVVDSTTAATGVNGAVPARGNGNYRGYEITGCMNITDNVTLKGLWQDSIAAKKSIGGRNTYHNFEMQLIFAW